MAETILEEQVRGTKKQEFFSSEDVVGKRVKNPEGYDLGEISSLRVDFSTGRVAYAVLRTGGVFGLGTKCFAIPVEAMVYRPGDDVFMVNISKSRLDSEPGFSEREWPREASWNLIETRRPMGPPSQEEARAVSRTGPSPKKTVTEEVREMPAARVRDPALAPEGARTPSPQGKSSFAHLSAADLQAYLKGMDYPAGRQDLIAHARKNEAPPEVITTLERFEDRIFRSAADVSTEFGAVR